jgi:hypothetical protein
LNIPKCFNHQNKFSDVFCLDENICVCFGCAFSEHKNHICVDIKSATEEKKIETVQLLKTIDINDFKNSILQVDEKILKRKESFNEEFLKLENEIKKLKEKFHQDVKDFEITKFELNEIFKFIQDLSLSSLEEMNLLQLIKIKKKLSELNFCDIRGFEICWDVFPSNMDVSTDKKTITQKKTDPRLAYSSFVIEKGYQDVEIQMKIVCVTWIGVGVAEASKVKMKDFTWNYSDYDKHETNLWSMNGYIWTTNSQTHKTSGKPSYINGNLINLKVCVNEKKLKMKTENDINWVVELPINLPVCFCVNLVGDGDSVTILSINKK